MSEVEQFPTGMLPRQLAAEHALCRGDVEPSSVTWSQRDPVTVAVGASGTWPYTVGSEHKTVVADGVPATYTLRVTHVYRREDGHRRIVHRHGDHVSHNPGTPEHPPMP